MSNNEQNVSKKQSPDYVLGFIFDGPNFVYLIRKSSPKEQAGDLNGIGGRVAQDENPLDAMKRHSIDEVGYHGIWTEYARMGNNDWSCLVYYSILTGPPPVAVKEDLAGAVPVEDLHRVPSSMRLVCGVYPLIHGAVDSIRNTDAPYMILEMAPQGHPE